jgi:hypothetical protein
LTRQFAADVPAAVMSVTQRPVIEAALSVSHPEAVTGSILEAVDIAR